MWNTWLYRHCLLVYVPLGLGFLAFFMHSPSGWVQSGFIPYLAIALWALVCRLISIYSLRGGVTAFYVGWLPLMAWFLGFIAATDTSLLVAMGRMSFAAMGVLTLGLLWRVPGTLAGVVLSCAVFSRDMAPVQIVVGSTLLVSVGLFGMLVRHLVDGLETAGARIALMARTDPLTGLGNRHALVEDYGLSGRDALSLMVWDLDGLKGINDALGHEAGDAFILDFVRVLRGALGPSSRAYRIGGDEFVSLHPSDTDGAALISAVRASFPAVSAGWSEPATSGLDEAMRRADAGMYADKSRPERRLVRATSREHAPSTETSRAEPMPT